MAETANTSDRQATTATRQIRVWQPEDGDHLWVFPDSPQELGSGGEFHIYLDPETDREAAASFARFSLGVGGALSEHRHVKSEEMGYLISGEGVLERRAGDGLVEEALNPGCVWYIPPGAWHAIANRGPEPLTLVFVTVPNVEKGLLSFFRRLSAPPGTPPPELSKEEFARLGAEHDFHLRPPDEA